MQYAGQAMLIVPRLTFYCCVAGFVLSTYFEFCHCDIDIVRVNFSP